SKAVIKGNRQKRLQKREPKLVRPCDRSKWRFLMDQTHRRDRPAQRVPMSPGSQRHEGGPDRQMRWAEITRTGPPHRDGSSMFICERIAPDPIPPPFEVVPNAPYMDDVRKRHERAKPPRARAGARCGVFKWLLRGRRGLEQHV